MINLYTGRPDPKKAAALKESLLKPRVSKLKADPEHGFDIDPIFKAMESGERVSYNAIERSFREQARALRLSEAITSTQMAITINLTMMHEIVDEYADWPALYRDLAELHTSNSIDEVWPEEWSDDIPIAVAETEPAPESRVAGGQVRIRNYEYARVLVIAKRLFDRDKMGIAKDAARKFGRKFEIAKDQAWLNALFRAGALNNLGNAAGMIPASNLAGQTTQMTTTPGPVTPQRLEDALTAPAYITDPFNNPLVVDFNTVVVDSFDRLKTQRYLNSQYTANQVQTDTIAGQNAGPFSDNVLRGAMTLAYSPLVKRTRGPLKTDGASAAANGLPWATMEKGRGPILQTVHDLEVDMENPNSGKSFDERSYRWQALVEFGVGVRNARLVYYGN